MISAASIIENFQRHGWRDNAPMDQVLQLRREQPAELATLIDMAVDQAIGQQTFLAAALDLMDGDRFASTVHSVWARRNDEDADRPWVIDMAALQLPRVFADDWDGFLAAAAVPQGSTRFLYHSESAWRALDDGTVRRWRHHLDVHPINDEQRAQFLKVRAPGGDVDVMRALALLYAGNPSAALFAWRMLFADGDDSMAMAWLHQAGYALVEDGLRPLHGEKPLHIEFSHAQRKRMTQDAPAWKREIWRLHPTWRAQGEPLVAAAMGGVGEGSCGLCHGPLHRLLRLAEPRRAGVPSDTAIDLCTCLACLGWESDGALFYRHDDQGRPGAHPSQCRGEAQLPQFPTDPFLAAEVTLFTAPDRWSRQEWGASNDRQNLSRVGGAPSWVQSAAYPCCPDCGTEMSFIMQLDSGLPLEDGTEWLWGSGGCNYSYWCAPCRVSAHLWQCT